MNTSRNTLLPDMLFVCSLLVVAGVFVGGDTRQWILDVSKAWPIASSFVKFALLAPLGEMAACRIRLGRYIPANFGLLPKALLWGGYGVLIKVVFTVFASGVPHTLGALGLDWATSGLQQEFGWVKLATAFGVSVGMNIIFSPFLMVAHKLTDMHVGQHNGALSALWTKVDWAGNFGRIDWDIMWGFVFMKTIPRFWIPAHTITFLLPAELQILFAAGLSMALGLILAIAGATKSD